MSSPLHSPAFSSHGSVAYQERVATLIDAAREFANTIAKTHVDSVLLWRFLHGERQAGFYIRNLGRILVRPLGDELLAIHQQLSDGFTQDLAAFTSEVSPTLFKKIEAIRPNDPTRTDIKLLIEQRMYAVEVRRAILRLVLTRINERYGKTEFHDLREASVWTDSFSRNLRLTHEVIHGTRTLLAEQSELFSRYIGELSDQIHQVERGARAQLGVIQIIQWQAELASLEQQVVNQLAARSAALEETTFQPQPPQPARSARVTSGGARKTVGMYLMGLAGLAGTGTIAYGTPDAKAAPTPAPTDGADSTRTARFPALVEGASQRVSTVLASLTEPAAAESIDAFSVRAGDHKIAQFFAMLPERPGRQTLVISTRDELQALVDLLSQKGYEAHEVLTILSLPSVETFRHPLTIDVRAGSRMPILYTYDEAMHRTAPHPVITLQNREAAVAAADSTTPVEAATSLGNPAQIVYRVQAGDRLSAIAARYGLSVEEIRVDNNLQGALLFEGQQLLLRRPTTPSANSEVVRSGGAIVSPAMKRRSAAPAGGDAAAGVKHSTAPERGMVTVISHDEVVARYGEHLFRDLESMPEEARAYLLSTVEEVASFFDVRPGDLMGILRAEQNDAGWRLHEPSVSVVGATGVAQIVPRTWNGWSHPEHNRFVADVREIDEHGGLGFDWSMRDAWRQWQAGAEASVLDGNNADPTRFENSVAGMARHLVHWGLTTEAASRDPQGFAARLADAIAVYNSGRTLDVSANFVQSSANSKTTGQYVAEAMATSEAVASYFGSEAQGGVVAGAPAEPAAAPGLSSEQRDELIAHFRELYDRELGVMLDDTAIVKQLDATPDITQRVASGELNAQRGAARLLEAIELAFIREGQTAIRNQSTRPWPFIHDTTSLFVQRTATTVLGRTLSLYEMDDLLHRTAGERDAILSALSTRAEARLFAQTKGLYQELLRRSERDLPVRNSEVTTLIKNVAGEVTLATADAGAAQPLLAEVRAAIEHSEEYQSLQPTSISESGFTATPLDPMPGVFKGFGVAVDYQVGGRHTGIDIANPRDGSGNEPPIFAVGAGTVVHVGPLYCDVANACRGGNSVVIDHGDQVYSIYSHNSAAEVTTGQPVTAGQRIGRQGNEGYSFGSHLHFEVHVGAPWSGDWEEPFRGGQFVDPMEWLP